MYKILQNVLVNVSLSLKYRKQRGVLLPSYHYKRRQNDSFSCTNEVCKIGWQLTSLTSKERLELPRSFEFQPLTHWKKSRRGDGAGKENSAKNFNPLLKCGLTWETQGAENRGVLHPLTGATPSIKRLFSKNLHKVPQRYWKQRGRLEKASFTIQSGPSL